MTPQASEASLAALRERIAAASRLCVLTGAGMSAESGIATFRDALTGLWARFDPAQLASAEGFRADPRSVWDWYAERRDGVRRALPNAGHLALGGFARRRPGVLTLITQNVDDLHQRAGNADAIRLHGDILEDRWFDRCARDPWCATDRAARHGGAAAAAAVRLRSVAGR
jgi:NAD-dependent deacetylase